MTEVTNDDIARSFLIDSLLKVAAAASDTFNCGTKPGHAVDLAASIGTTLRHARELAWITHDLLESIQDGQDDDPACQAVDNLNSGDN